MTTGLLAALAILWPFVLVAFALKVFPDLLGKLLLKGVEHASEARLARVKDELGRETALIVENAKAFLARDTSVQIEQTKADLLATYSTLQTSVNIIATGQSGMREGIISSVQKLWVTVLQLRSDFGGLVTLTMLLMPEEISTIVQGGGTAGAKEYVQRYQNEQWMNEHSVSSASSGVEMARLFCGDRLWLLFHVLRAAYVRHAWLMVRSLKQKRYTDWRADDFYLSILRLALHDDVIEQACDRQELGLQSLLNQLEVDFLHEAARVMSGSKALSESLADMQAVMLLEKQKLAEARSPVPPTA